MGDALDRLRQKNRPKVQPRSTQVEHGSEDIQTSRHTEADKSENSRHTDTGVSRDIEGKDTLDSRHIDSNMSETHRHIDILSSRHMGLNMSEPLEEVEVKRSTFRLEAGLISRLHRLCKDSGVSREVFIEAMFEHVEAHPSALEQIMDEASLKHEHRLQLANRKRAASMNKRYGQD